MRLFNFIAATVMVPMLFSCSLPTRPENNDTGSARVSIGVGRVGTLAKRADINLDTLYVTLSAPGEATIEDKFAVSGSDRQTVTKTYNGLASLLKTWTLAAIARDVNNVVIHSGSTAFIVPARDVIEVSLNLDAQYSMLKANFYPLRDSVTSCSLSVDGARVAGISFHKQTLLGDTVKLAHDYLTASPAPGTSHTIRMDVFGDMWGFDELLYTGQETIDVISGENKTYTITLQWVGPSAPPPGAATMTVTLGAVGTVTFNGILEKWVKVLDENFDAYANGQTSLSSPWEVFWDGVAFQSRITDEQAESAPHCWRSTAYGSWARAEGYPITRKSKLKYEAAVFLTNPAVPAMIGFEYKISGSESRGFAYAWIEGASYAGAWHRVSGEIDCDHNTVTIAVDGATLHQYSYEPSSETETRENAFSHFTISCGNGSYSTGSVLFDNVRLWYME